MEFSAVAEFCRLTSFHSEERLKKQIEVPQWLKTRQQSLAEDDAIEAFRAKDEGANEKKAAAAAPKALPIVVEEKAETVVAKMMQSKMDELLVSHPLRSFGCKLVVSLFHHVKGNVKPGRMMVVLEDTVRYPQFREWVQVCLWGAPCKAGEELILQYTNEFGESITINNGASLASWLDIMWYKHPPELNVYEVEALLERQQATMDAAQDLFALYDADNSGKIEVKEMLMTKEMADMLGLPRETLLEFHKEMFHEMDVNGDGSVSYDEFVAHFNQLNSALKSGLMRDHHKYSRNRLQSLTLEASSYRIALAEIANQPARTVDDVTSGRGGRLSLDGNDGCDYAIELRFPRPSPHTRLSPSSPPPPPRILAPPPPPHLYLRRTTTLTTTPTTTSSSFTIPILLAQLFGSCGQVVSVQLDRGNYSAGAASLALACCAPASRRAPRSAGSHPKSAVVRFDVPASADLAVKQVHGTRMRSHQLTVKKLTDTAAYSARPY